MVSASSLAYQFDIPSYVTARSRKPSILLVEDNRSDAILARRMLEAVWTKHQFTLAEAVSAGHALEKLSEQHFDTILLDLDLPDTQGASVVAALHSAAPDSTIIVYSGIYDNEMRRQALLCGAKHYLVKGRESAFSLRFMLQQSLN